MFWIKGKKFILYQKNVLFVLTFIIIFAAVALFLYQQKNEERERFEEEWMYMDAREIGNYLSKNDITASEQRVEKLKEEIQIWFSQLREQKSEKIRKDIEKHGVEFSDMEDGINKLYEISKKDGFNDTEAVYTLIGASFDLSLMESLESIAENDSSLSQIQSVVVSTSFLMANYGIVATTTTIGISQELESCMSETSNNTFFCINKISRSIENASEGFMIKGFPAETNGCSVSLTIKKSNNLVIYLDKRLKNTKNPYLKLFRGMNHDVYSYCGKKALEEIRNNEYECYETKDYNKYRSAMMTIVGSGHIVQCITNQTIIKIDEIFPKSA